MTSMLQIQPRHKVQTSTKFVSNKPFHLAGGRRSWKPDALLAPAAKCRNTGHRHQAVQFYAWIRRRFDPPRHVCVCCCDQKETKIKALLMPFLCHKLHEQALMEDMLMRLRMHSGAPPSPSFSSAPFRCALSPPPPLHCTHILKHAHTQRLTTSEVSMLVSLTSPLSLSLHCMWHNAELQTSHLFHQDDHADDDHDAKSMCSDISAVSTYSCGGKFSLCSLFSVFSALLFTLCPLLCASSLAYSELESERCICVFCTPFFCHLCERCDHESTAPQGWCKLKGT